MFLKFNKIKNYFILQIYRAIFLTDTSGRAVTQYILVLRLVKTGIAYEKQHFINLINLIFISFSCLKKKRKEMKKKSM